MAKRRKAIKGAFKAHVLTPHATDAIAKRIQGNGHRFIKSIKGIGR